VCVCTCVRVLRMYVCVCMCVCVCVCACHTTDICTKNHTHLISLKHTATHCNTHCYTHYNTHCNTLQHTHLISQKLTLSHTWVLTSLQTKPPNTQLRDKHTPARSAQKKNKDFFSSTGCGGLSLNVCLNICCCGRTHERKLSSLFIMCIFLVFIMFLMKTKKIHIMKRVCFSFLQDDSLFV